MDPELDTTTDDLLDESLSDDSCATGSENSTNLNSVIDELLVKLIEKELNEENSFVENMLLSKLSADNTGCSRIPVPQNITEIGGYYNLISDAFGDDKTMKRRLIASALGLPYIG